jgi:hypothetical protein
MGAMTTYGEVVVAAAVVVLAGGVDAGAQVHASAASGWQAPGTLRRAPAPDAGTISSVVRDASGSPVAGAIVSAVGGRTMTALTDASGHCTLASLPPGDYLVRVHRIGFVVGNSAIVRVSAGSTAAHQAVLRRSDAPIATIGTNVQPEILAAGFLAPSAATAGTAEAEGATDEGDDHSEAAWRIRHLRRSVLKDAVDRAAIDAGNDADAPDMGLWFGSVMMMPARAAASLFATSPVNGEINLLTSSTFDSAAQLADANFARGIAYLSLGSTAGRSGDWNMRAAMTQGDVASWMVAGSFLARLQARHRYEAGMSYASQRYIGANPAAMASVADGTRNAGAVFAFDTWSVAPGTTIVYGARYARYGYMEDALFSPRLRLELTPLEHVRLKVSASRRVTAPGAEEFVQSASSNSWVPPERTFAPLVGSTFSPERTNMLEIAFEHDMSGGAVLGLRTFYQDTQNQVATFFGLGRLDRTAADLDHYYVGNAGDVIARGWAVSLSRSIAGRLRGSVDYRVTTAHWTPSGETAVLALWAPSSVRATSERLHDLTTSLEAQIPYTATRVFAVYRISNGFGASEVDQAQGAGARFDVQVTQALPFLDFTSAEWEMLVGVRNMFRDIAPDGSVYDELLVIRPPKRVVGGLTVRF